MKRLLLLIIVICYSIGYLTAQNVQNVPRYKMYQTENIYILLKLDTATGKVWMVQYSLGDNTGMVVPVDDSSLLIPGTKEEAGRFELYPTKNMYNFILLDTKYGNTYQVQWSLEIMNRVRIPIK